MRISPGASFCGATLLNADFSGADLTNARFEYAIFNNSIKLDGAIIAGANFFGVTSTLVIPVGSDLEHEIAKFKDEFEDTARLHQRRTCRDRIGIL